MDRDSRGGDHAHSGRRSAVLGDCRRRARFDVRLRWCRSARRWHGALRRRGGARRKRDRGWPFRREHHRREAHLLGQLASGFGSNGTATIAPGIARAVAIQSDGKVVVAGDDCSNPTYFCGTGGLVLARLNPDGALDSSFGAGGVVHTAGTMRALALALAPGGKIVVGGDIRAGNGFRQMVLARINSDGRSFDSSFGNGGLDVPPLGQDSAARGIAVQPNGKIVIGGSQGPGTQQAVNAFVARLDSDGGLDSSFGGISTPPGANTPWVYWYFHPVSGGNSVFNDAGLDPAGGIVAAGWDTQDLQRKALFARLTCSGQLQVGFGSGGVATVPSGSSGSGEPTGANSVGVVGGDRLVGAGRYLDSGLSDVGVWGLGTNGASAFATTTPTGADGRGLAIDSSGRILVAGADLSPSGVAQDGLVARYLGFGPPPGATNVCGGGATPQPPTVTTGDASDVGQSSATVSGTVNPNGEDTTYHFDYGTSTSYGQSTGSSGAGSGSAAVPATASLTGLDSGTTYHYRLVAANDAGTTPGGDRTFTTAGQPPPSSKARILATDSFLNRSGAAAKVYVGCLGDQGCSGKVVARSSGDGTVLAKKRSYHLGRNKGALFGAALTDVGDRRLRHARRGKLGMTIAVTNDSGTGKTEDGRLLGPDAKPRSAGASLDADRAFSKRSGKAKVWLGCLGVQRCEGKLRLVEDGTRVARADYSTPSNSARFVRLNLDSQATGELQRDGRLKLEARASNRNGAGASRKLVILRSG